jgi:hypothetical protein
MKCVLICDIFITGSIRIIEMVRPEGASDSGQPLSNCSLNEVIIFPIIKELYDHHKKFISGQIKHRTITLPINVGILLLL